MPDTSEDTLENLQAKLATNYEQTKPLMEKAEAAARDPQNNSDLTDDETRQLNALMDQNDEIMAKITHQKLQARIKRQKNMAETGSFYIDAGPSAGEAQAQSRAGSAYPIPTRPGKKYPDVSMRRHYGGLKVFTGGPDDEFLAFKFGAFINAVMNSNPKAIRWCNENGIRYMDQHVESVNPAGGVWVMDEISDRIIRLVDQYGVYRGNVFIEPMTTDKKDITRRKNGMKAHHVGERQPTPLSDPNLWDQVSLVAKKVSAYTSISIELEEDSYINLVDSLSMEAAQAFAEREDEDGFNGEANKSSGGIWGILQQAKDPDYGAMAIEAAAGHNTFLTIDMADITKLLAAFPAYGLRPGLGWYMSNHAKENIVGRLSIEVGGTRKEDVTSGTPMEFRGYPVNVSETFPGAGDLSGEPMLAFGNLGLSSTMGVRREIDFRTSNDLLFETDEIALKWTERYDMVNHNLLDSQSPQTKAGPMVVLIGKA